MNDRKERPSPKEKKKVSVQAFRNQEYPLFERDGILV